MIPRPWLLFDTSTYLQQNLFNTWITSSVVNSQSVLCAATLWWTYILGNCSCCFSLDIIWADTGCKSTRRTLCGLENGEMQVNIMHYCWLLIEALMRFLDCTPLPEDWLDALGQTQHDARPSNVVWFRYSGSLPLNVILSCAVVILTHWLLCLVSCLCW